MRTQPKTTRASPHETTPALTIGVPAYDEWAKVRRMLESLVAQETALKFEVILIDDCHPEQLADKVQVNFPQVHAHRNETNQGPAYNRNRIIELARAPFIAFFDADCIVPPDWIDTVRPHLESNTVLSGRVVRPDGSVEWEPRRATWMGVSVQSKSAEANVASSNNMVVSRKLAINAGGFNEHLRIYFEDSLFSLNCRRAGGSVQYLAAAEVVHDHHSLRNPGRLEQQSRNTLWAMHHYYHRQPMLRSACTIALCTNYGVKAVIHGLACRPAFSVAYLRGAWAGLRKIRQDTWRERWLEASSLSG